MGWSLASFAGNTVRTSRICRSTRLILSRPSCNACSATASWARTEIPPDGRARAARSGARAGRGSDALPACRTCCRTVTLAGARDRTNCTSYRSVPRSRGKSSTPSGSRAGIGGTSWSVPTVTCSLSSREDAELPEEVRVVEIDPGMRDLLVLDLHHRTPVDAPFSSSGGYVRQRALVGTAGAPANDDVTLTRGEDRLHIEVQIGKRREVELEELPRSLMPHERRRKRIRLPYRLRVQPLHEGLHVVRVPSRKVLSGDVKVVLSSHCQPSQIMRGCAIPPPPAPASTSCPSRG